MKWDVEAPAARLTGHLAWLGLSLVLAVAALAALCPPASAASIATRPLLFSFDGSGTAAGSFSSSIQAIAVDEATGTVYVADNSQEVLGAFDSSGNLLFELDGSNTPQGDFSALYGIAVDNSGGSAAGRIYVADGYQHNVVHAFDPAGNFLFQLDGSDLPLPPPANCFCGLAGVAADPDGNLFVLRGFNDLGASIAKYVPTADSASFGSRVPVNLLAAGLALGQGGGFLINNRDERDVEMLGPDGALGAILRTSNSFGGLASDLVGGSLFVHDRSEVLEFGPNGAPLRRFAGTVGGEFARGIAYDASTERTYVADGLSKEINVYGSLTTVTGPDLTLDPASQVSYFTAKLSGTVNPQGSPTTYRFEYKGAAQEHWIRTPTEAAGSGSSPVAVSTSLSGLQHGTEYEARLVAVSGDTGAVPSTGPKVFATPVVPPPAISPPAEVTSSSAELSGSVNPQGVATTWHFEYSIDGEEWTPVGDPQDAGSGTADVPVSITAGGLLPSQSYKVRLVATNSGGSVNSPVEELTTLPVPVERVETAWVAPRGATTARLNGKLDTKGDVAGYRFEYSADGVEWLSTPTAQSGDDLRGLTLVSAELAGLAPQTTYAYRFVAQGSVGSEEEGAIEEFTTRTTAEVAPLARGIELVNSPDKGNQNVAQPMFVTLAGPLGRSDQMLWTVNGGTPQSNNGSTNPFLAERTAGGWTSTSISPPADRQIGNGNLRYDLVLPSADFDRFLVVVTQGLAISPYTYVRISNGVSEVLFDHPASANQDAARINVRASEDLERVIVPGEDGNLYDIGSGGAPALVSALPNGSPPPCGVSQDFLDGFGAIAGNGTSVAADGSAAFFAAGTSCAADPGLYRRDLVAGTTQLISNGPSRPAHFIGANDDGSGVVYSTRSRLVPAVDGNAVADIYRWTAGVGNECLTCEATNATPVDLAVNLREAIASADLSHVYFLSAELGEEANLYVASDAGVAPVGSIAIGEGKPLTRDFFALNRTGEVAAFVSEKPNTTDAIGTCEGGGQGEPHRCGQIFRYDALDESLECVSCRRGGVTNGEIHRGVAIQPIFRMSADASTIAFVTDTPVLATDVNGADDVYEWRNGERQLVTDGVTEYPGSLAGPTVWGIDGDGRNIFFSVAAPLTGFELDGLANLYDARVGGGFAPPEEPARCDGDSCQGPLQVPPGWGGPGSAALQGPARAARPHKKAGKKCRAKRDRRRAGKCKRHGPRRGAAR